MNEIIKPNVTTGPERAERVGGEEGKKENLFLVLSSSLFTTDQVENYLHRNIYYGYMGPTF